MVRIWYFTAGGLGSILCGGTKMLQTVWHGQKETNKKMKQSEKTGFEDFPGGSDGKVSAYNAGEPGSIPGSERSPGEGNGNPLQ